MIICGIGGQGNVLASEIVSSTLKDMGYRVAVGETYGASQRGGSVMSHVRVSETEDFGVLIPSGEAHIIIGFEPLETLRMARQYANKETMIIYDPRPVYPLGVLQSGLSSGGRNFQRTSGPGQGNPCRPCCRYCHGSRRLQSRQHRSARCIQPPSGFTSEHRGAF